MTNPNKTNRIRILGDVDISELKRRVLLIPEKIWTEQNEIKPNKFGVLDKTEHIVFRFIDNFKDHRSYSDKAVWEDWKDLIEPLLELTKKAYNYERAEYPRIMLAKLPAGESIKPHIDRSPAAQFPHKLHIPLISNEETCFVLDNEKIKMELGTIYEVNNRINHSVINNGQTDRIHLIFELFEIN
jgi:hypothetical protein